MIFFTNFFFFFFFVIIFSNMVFMFFNSLFILWMAMEINLLSFLPLLFCKPMNNKEESSLSSLNFFFVQSVSSMFFVFLLVVVNKTVLFYDSMVFLFCFVLLLKSGLPPFHAWLQQILVLMNFSHFFLLMVVQKFLPLYMMQEGMNNIIIFSSLIILFIGSLGGLNNNNVSLILMFSSFNHSSWLIVSLMTEQKLFLAYFIVYGFTMYLIILLMMMFKLKFLSRVSTVPLSLKIWFFLLIFSLMGLPPFLGFSVKLSVLKILMMKFNVMMLIFFLASTCISLLFYFNLIGNSVFSEVLSYKFKIKILFSVKLMFKLFLWSLMNFAALTILWLV